MSLGLAFTSFFKILSNASFAQKVRSLNLPDSPIIKEPIPLQKQIIEEPIKKQTRSEAVTLLSSLQRDARLIDFLMENIKDYDDAQIGAAVRDVHKKSKDVLQKMFSIEPVSSLSEGQPIKVPENFDQGQYTLTGKISGKGPFNGNLEHAGWKVTKAEIPLWNGTSESANIIAPIEVEIK